MHITHRPATAATRARRLAAPCLAAAAILISGVAPAYAELPSLNPGDLLGGGIGKTVAGLTCDPTRHLTTHLGDLAQGVSGLLCNVDLLDYSVHTVYKRADGRLVVRDTRAVVGLPALVEVGDGDILPDLVVSFVPQSTSRFRLQIDRAPLELATLPISVEAVANDPTKGALPRQRIAFGYDALGSKAPRSFLTQVQVGQSATEAGAATLALGYTTQGAGVSLDVIGGLFDGTPAARTNPVGARMSYTPMPARAGIELVVGKRLGVRATAASPSRLAIFAEQVQGAAVLRARALLDQLPAWVETVYDPLGADRRRIGYAAAAAVGTFTLDYAETSAGHVGQAATVRAIGVPTGMTLEQTGARSGTFATSGGSLRSVEAGFARDGMPRLRAGATGPYGYVSERDGVRSYAARIDGLNRAAFDASGPIVVDARLDARTPLDIEVDAPDLQLDGTLRTLPRHVRVVADLAAGSVDYDGFGDTIGRVAFTATGAEPFFERVRHIDATLRALPAAVTLKLAMTTVVGERTRRGIDVRASAPIGSIAALLSSDAADPPPPGVSAGRQGVSVIDTLARFSAFARVTGLRAARFLGAVPVVAQAAELPYELHVEHDAGPFDVRYENADATVSGDVLDVPATSDISYAPKAGVLRYDGFGATVGRIDLEATGSKPFFGRVRYVKATARALPSAVALTMLSVPVVDGRVREGVDARASSPIGSLEALLSSSAGASAPPGVAAGRQGVSVTDTAATFSAFARISGLRVVRYLGALPAGPAGGAAPYDLQVTHAAGPFDLRYQAAGSTITGEIADLPASIVLSYAPDSGALHYDGGEIERIMLQRADDLPFLGDAKLLRATIRGLPSPVDLTLPKAGDTMTVVSASKPLRKVDLLITSGREAAPAGNPDDTGASALLVSSAPNCALCPESKFVLAARVNGFRSLRFGNRAVAGDQITDVGLGLAAPQRFVVRASGSDIGTIALDANRLPTRFDARLRNSDFTWSASAGVDALTLRGEDLPGAGLHFVNARLRQLPSSFTVGLNEQIPGTGVVAASGPIGEIELDVANRLSRFRPGNLPADRNTIRLSTALDPRTGDPGTALEAHARVFDVKQGVLSTFPITFAAKVEFGTQPKPIDVSFDDVHATPNPQVSDGKHTEIHVGQPPARLEVDGTTIDSAVVARYKAFDRCGSALCPAGFPQIDFATSSHKPSGDDDNPVALRALSAVVKDLPPELSLCVDTSVGPVPECHKAAPDVYSVDPGLGHGRVPITQFNELTASLRTVGAVNRVNLAHLFRCKRDDSLAGFRDHGACDDPSRRRDDGDWFEINRLLAKQFQFEYANGDSREQDDGEPVEDDLIKLYIETDPSGVNIEHLESYVAHRDKRVQVIANDLGSPIVADHAFAAIDATPPPGLEAASGHMTCDHISIRTFVPVIGTTDVEPLLPICD